MRTLFLFANIFTFISIFVIAFLMTIDVQKKNLPQSFLEEKYLIFVLNKMEDIFSLDYKEDNIKSNIIDKNEIKNIKKKLYL